MVCILNHCFVCSSMALSMGVESISVHCQAYPLATQVLKSSSKMFDTDISCTFYMTICTIKQKKYYTYIFKNLLLVNMLFLFLLWLFHIGMNKKQQKVASKDETAANKTNINLQVLNVFSFFFST